MIFEMISNEPGGSERPEAPRYSEEPLSGVNFWFATGAELIRIRTCGSKMKVRRGIRENCVCGPVNYSSTWVKAPCGVLFLVNKLKVFSHSLFLTADWISSLINHLQNLMFACLTSVALAKRIAFRCDHSAQKRVRCHYLGQFRCQDWSTVFSFHAAVVFLVISDQRELRC